MPDIQDVFARLQKLRGEQRNIRKQFKEALKSSFEHEEISEKIKTLREKKKQIELSVRQNMESDIRRLEDLTIDIESDQELISDIALTKLMKGETVKVTDEHNAEFEPIFVVKFKKVI